MRRQYRKDFLRFLFVARYRQSAMVKIFLTPKSIEAQLMKRISEGLDHGLLGDICKPRSDTHRYVVIAYCQDFTRTWQDYSDGATVRRNFQTLYDQWFPGMYQVGMAAFSFNHDDVDGMMEILNAATVFHMGGVHGRRGTTCLAAHPVQVQRLIATSAH